MTHFDRNDIRRLDGGLLLVFRELLRRRRATEVADALGLSQSAISHALTRLRDLFGDPLFIRRPHGMEPTRRALALGPRIETLIEFAAAALRSEDRFDPAQSERRFNVGATEFVISLIGAPLVETMRKEAPKASLHVRSMMHDPALDALKRGEIDLAIGRFGAVRSGCLAETLYEDRYCVVARRGHPQFTGRISYADYKCAGHVFAGSPGEGAETEKLPHPSDILANAIVPHWLTALVIVSACDAIATVPRRLAERQADVLGLQVLRASFVGERITVSAIRRAGWEDPGVDWLLKRVRAAVQ